MMISKKFRIYFELSEHESRNREDYFH